MAATDTEGAGRHALRSVSQLLFLYSYYLNIILKRFPTFESSIC